jgi:intracellular sulfur oxidation DsrE/DsrF family protein
MKGSQGVNRLHAFVDGQLDPSDKARLLEEMERDPALKRELCELHNLKEYVNCAFDVVPEPPVRRRGESHANWQRFGRGIAAALLLGLGFLLGRLAERPAELPGVSVETRHVVFHLNESDAEKFEAVLKSAQAVAEAEEAQVEVVANGGGLDLVRADRSPYSEQVRALMRKYPNLQFVACNITLKKQKGKGEPLLVRGTQIAPSAAEHILQRMEEGWDYVGV